MAGPVSAAPMAVGLAPHLIALPILLPLLAGSLAAAVGGYSRALSRVIGGVAALAHLIVCVLLLQASETGAVDVYSMGNWAAPFGIVLVLDRLSAMMLLLTSGLSLIGLLYANAAWAEEGRRFQALWQFQVMGLSGAFLTGDLFNLFVFFEVLLAASYALLLHGGGRSRVGATFHFVVINLVASSIFLIAVALLYSVTGTLNMAHLAVAIDQLPAGDIGLVAVAGILLLSVFLVKSGLAPFHFWIPASYGSAAAPVVALIVAKIGAYAIVRVFTLLFGADTGGVDTPASALANLAQPWIFGLAMLTLLIGSAGTLASQTLRQLAATLTLVSIGTLFVPLALGSADSLSSATFYLVHSTVATGTLFLVAEWVGTHRGKRGDRLLPGEAIPHPVLIGGALLWALITSVGLPPTSGFIGKVLVLDSLTGFAEAPWFWAAILISSFCSLVAVSRALSVLLWNNTDEVTEQQQEREPWVNQEYLLTPVQSHNGRAAGALIATAMVLLLSLSIVVAAGPLKIFTERLAAQVLDRQAYTEAVLQRGQSFAPLVRPSPARASGAGEAVGQGGAQ